MIPFVEDKHTLNALQVTSTTFQDPAVETEKWKRLLEVVVQNIQISPPGLSFKEIQVTNLQQKFHYSQRKYITSISKFLVTKNGLVYLT